MAVSSGSPGDVRQRPVALTTLATITGPVVGAIARDNQSCCLEFSLLLAAICGPVLALCVVAEVVPLPLRRERTALRLSLRTIGWFVWHAIGQFPFMHAF